MPKSRFDRWCTSWAATFGGRNETHVANATDEPVRIIVSEKETKVEKISVGAKGNVTVKTKEGVETQSVTILPGEVHRFDRKNSSDRMTVVKLDERSVPVENMPIPTNESYIVTNTGIKRQDYGNPNLFKDEHGNDH